MCMKKKANDSFKLFNHFSSNYINLKVYMLLIIALIALSSYMRYKQYDYWLQHKDTYFVENYPAMRTLDAYRFLRYAKEYKNGTYYKTKKDKFVSYPNNLAKPKPIPMISFFIAKISNYTGLSIYESGLALIPILSGLFILPFALYFYFSGMPMAGLVGSFVGTFSWMYYTRTSMGRVDTDLLQLFFLFIIPLFMLLMLESKKYSSLFVNFILSLIFAYLYILWYDHPGIASIYAFFSVFVLLLKTYKDKKLFLASIAVFILTILIVNYLGYLNPLKYRIHLYITNFLEPNTSSVNMLNLITEGKHLPFLVTLQYYALHSIAFDLLGLALFFVVIFYLRIRVIPLMPTIALGFMSFFSSVRTMMFLAPFIGAGIGFAVDWFINYLKQKKQFNEIKLSAIGISISAIIMAILAQSSAIKYIPPPKIKPQIVKSFLDIKKKINNAVIVSWWDYGLPIEDICGFPTYIDGISQFGNKTYYIAKGFISDNQTQLRNIIAYMDRYGNGKTPINWNQVLSYNKKIAHNNNYILFTEDMLRKIGAMSYLVNGKHNILAYDELECYNFKNNILKCNKALMNFDTGLINHKFKINKVLFIYDGYTKKELSFFKNGEIIVELVLKNGKLLHTLLCDTKTYKTNFNQMYILGNYDKNLFKEVYNNYPYARMFKVLK